jgi:hypothetical protein
VTLRLIEVRSNHKWHSYLTSVLDPKLLPPYVVADLSHQKGLTSEPSTYFADPKNRDLGIVKQKRTSKVKLIVAPFPERMRGQPGFFFESNSKSILTTRIQA